MPGKLLTVALLSGLGIGVIIASAVITPLIAYGFMALALVVLAGDVVYHHKYVGKVVGYMSHYGASLIIVLAGTNALLLVIGAPPTGWTVHTLSVVVGIYTLGFIVSYGKPPASLRFLFAIHPSKTRLVSKLPRYISSVFSSHIPERESELYAYDIRRNGMWIIPIDDLNQFSDIVKIISKGDFHRMYHCEVCQEKDVFGLVFSEGTYVGYSKERGGVIKSNVTLCEDCVRGRFEKYIDQQGISDELTARLI